MVSKWSKDDALIWMSGGALILGFLMVAGLILVIVVHGLGGFWPQELTRYVLRDGRVVLGQETSRVSVRITGLAGERTAAYRLQVRTGDRARYPDEFTWLNEGRVARRDVPREAVVVEQVRGGDLFGFLDSFVDDGMVVARGYEAVRAHYQEQSPELERLRRQRALSIVLSLADDRQHTVSLANVQRIYAPNAMTTWTKVRHYMGSAWSYLWSPPRDENRLGGVYPAIFGTTAMVILMSVVVMPFGVLAAFYLREYGKPGPFLNAVRIAVNSLAGVPSIVFGVFGLGFFVYFLGGTLDRLLFPADLPEPTFARGGILWCALTLALLTLPVVIVAVEEGLAGVPPGLREASHALGATRFETLWRVVVPVVLPSILTGLILSVARAAGTVAPLMITGVVAFTAELPVDGAWPFVHLEREFMHLGFHIFDTGFRADSGEASLPMAYTSTLLLLAIVVALNAAAIGLRSRLRKRYSLAAA
ncbi:MAG: phosphate ABC transporter permease PstA [Gemmatimonadetes bacterium]|nr:phosphate ABC transporter permease PstA [Gemmatimonadota bacterium]